MSEAVRQFTQDRARLFDLEQTNQLFKLAEVSQANRDPSWTEAFFHAAWYASLEVAATFQGPDFLPYLRMHLPRPGVAFDSNSLGNVVQAVLDLGLGIAVFASPEATEPLYVFTMGVLSSLLQYDSWRGDPTDLEELARPVSSVVEETRGLQTLTMDKAQKIFVGPPASTFLPAYTARALYRHLHEGWKIEEPRIALLLYPAGVPTRNLVMNRKMSEELRLPARSAP